ncbi:HD domain-containing phosphohydrolase [Roseateles sp. BYS87W]|uniref:HD domain-containing phosphohydrolase n=1 Tax=Pelomonas baiyunensis TaxID=3299026 RepID=A0ABW7GZ01_9BURK
MSRQRVQVIDDNAINLALFQALLGKLPDCDAVVFADAHAGLAWAQAQRPDLIVLDYMMPGLDGVQLLQALRQTPGCEDLPVLMITADADKDTRYRALDAGATDFLTKPVDRVEFSARARNLLALSRARRALLHHADRLAAEVREATAELRLRELETVLRLSRAAEFRDPETGAHILRMAHYAQLIGRHLGLNGDDLDLLLHAAPLHDIGKVGIPDHILLKPGKLTPEEFEVMKQHARHGYDILKDSSSAYLRAGADIAHGHHEKFDGSGYPQGLAGEAIPLFSRIVAVADVFDALTSQRPYKPAWPLDRAQAFIREASGQHFDPACVDAFLGDWPGVLAIRERFADDDAALAPQLAGLLGKV